MQWLQLDQTPTLQQIWCRDRQSCKLGLMGLYGVKLIAIRPKMAEITILK